MLRMGRYVELNVIADVTVRVTPRKIEMIRYVNNKKEFCSVISHQLVYGSTGGG